MMFHDESANLPGDLNSDSKFFGDIHASDQTSPNSVIKEDSTTFGMDLYSDLLSQEQQTNADVREKVLKENAEFKLINSILSKDVSELNKQAEKLKRDNDILKRNISTLYKTAKLEIGWKDKEIFELRRRYDNMVFRRKFDAEDTPADEMNKRQCSNNKGKSGSNPEKRRSIKVDEWTANNEEIRDVPSNSRRLSTECNATAASTNPVNKIKSSTLNSAKAHDSKKRMIQHFDKPRDWPISEEIKMTKYVRLCKSKRVSLEGLEKDVTRADNKDTNCQPWLEYAKIETSMASAVDDSKRLSVVNHAGNDKENESNVGLIENKPFVSNQDPRKDINQMSKQPRENSTSDSSRHREIGEMCTSDDLLNNDGSEKFVKIEATLDSLKNGEVENKLKRTNKENRRRVTQLVAEKEMELKSKLTNNEDKEEDLNYCEFGEKESDRSKNIIKLRSGSGKRIDDSRGLDYRNKLKCNSAKNNCELRSSRSDSTRSYRRTVENDDGGGRINAERLGGIMSKNGNFNNGNVKSKNCQVVSEQEVESKLSCSLLEDSNCEKKFKNVIVGELKKDRYNKVAPKTEIGGKLDSVEDNRTTYVKDDFKKDVEEGISSQQVLEKACTERKCSDTGCKLPDKDTVVDHSDRIVSQKRERVKSNVTHTDCGTREKSDKRSIFKRENKLRSKSKSSVKTECSQDKGKNKSCDANRQTLDEARDDKKERKLKTSSSQTNHRILRRESRRSSKSDSSRNNCVKDSVSYDSVKSISTPRYKIIKNGIKDHQKESVDVSDDPSPRHTRSYRQSDHHYDNKSVSHAPQEVRSSSIRFSLRSSPLKRSLSDLQSKLKITPCNLDIRRDDDVNILRHSVKVEKRNATARASDCHEKDAKLSADLKISKLEQSEFIDRDRHRKRQCSDVEQQKVEKLRTSPRKKAPSAKRKIVECSSPRKKLKMTQSNARKIQTKPTPREEELEEGEIID